MKKNINTCSNPCIEMESLSIIPKSDVECRKMKTTKQTEGLIKNKDKTQSSISSTDYYTMQQTTENTNRQTLNKIVLYVVCFAS